MTTKPQTLASLDGVRGFACLLVIISHSNSITPFRLTFESGPLGVMLFFTLSGFLMAYHYMPGKTYPLYWCAFLVRRFMRVYPLYALVVVMVAIAGNTISNNPYLAQFTMGRLIDHLLLGKTIGVFWTIPLEIKFYVLFAITGWLCLLQPSCLLAILGIAWVALLLINPQVNRMNVFTYTSYFVAGMITAQLYQKNIWARFKDWHWNALACTCLISFFFFAASLYRERGQPAVDLWEYSFFFSPLMVIFLLSVAKSERGIHHLFANRVARFVGHISYSLYLIHYYIFMFCFHYPIKGSIPHALIILPCVFALAWLLYKTVEIPFHKLGIKISNRIYNQG